MIELLPTVWISKEAELGDGIILGRNIRIFGPTRIRSNTLIEDGVTIGHPSPADVQTARSALRHLTMSGHHDLCQLDGISTAHTFIGPDSTIRGGSVIYAGVMTGSNFDCAHNVTVRENSRFGDNCYLEVNTEVRRDVIAGHNATLAGTVADRSVIEDDVTALGHLMHKYRTPRRGGVEPAPTIENAVFVGRRACVIGNVRLGARSYVAAGAVVTHDVAPGALVVGPASRVLFNRSPILFEESPRD